jgi:hypothetical protein
VETAFEKKMEEDTRGQYRVDKKKKKNIEMRYARFG